MQVEKNMTNKAKSLEDTVQNALKRYQLIENAGELMAAGVPPNIALGDDDFKQGYDMISNNNLCDQNYLYFKIIFILKLSQLHVISLKYLRSLRFG